MKVNLLEKPIKSVAFSGELNSYAACRSLDIAAVDYNPPGKTLANASSLLQCYCGRVIGSLDAIGSAS